MPKEQFHEKYPFMRTAERLSFDEIVRLARLFVPLGVRKLRLTGGEPLLRANLPDLIADLYSVQGIEDIALTTNGVLLAQHAAELVAAGLNRVTVSLDSLDPVVFKKMNGGLGEVEDVLRGLEQAARAGLNPIKVNAVIQRGLNDHTALDLVERFRGTGIIVRFIEYMDVGTLNGWRREDVVTSRELLARISARWAVKPLESNYRGEVAKRYGFVDGQGEIGFISSVSEPFCGDCHRARLSAEGVLYTCLFAAKGTNLREALRAGASDAELTGLLQNVWRGRADRYSELRGRLRESGEPRRVEMYRMGG
jgi:cyclic pyranopterin phosphate synthase